MDLDILVENVLNAVTAGITIGSIYGLMCIGLGLIFGIMRIRSEERRVGKECRL